MPGIERPYYWDSNLFVAWLQGENRPDGEMEGLNYFIDKFEKGQIQLITSTLTITEVLGPKGSPAGIPQLFDDFLKRPNILTISVDSKIAKMARDIRLYFQSNPERYNNKTLCTPDSIHLATAIINNVEIFHTFDTNGYGRSLGLITVDGEIAGHKIKIEKPHSKQIDILLK